MYFFYDLCKNGASVDVIRSKVAAHRLPLSGLINRRARLSDYPLCAAIRYSNVNIVHYLLDNGANVNVSSKGETPLYIASRKPYITIVRHLLACGALPNTKCTFGNTALFAAAKCSCSEVVVDLLAAGANISHQNDAGETVLHYVSKSSGYSISTAKCLVDAGVDIDHKNKSGETALATAIAYEKHDIAKYLIECGASV